MLSLDSMATPPSGNCSFSPGNGSTVSTGSNGQPNVAAVEGTFTELQPGKSSLKVIYLHSAVLCLVEKSPHPLIKRCLLLETF